MARRVAVVGAGMTKFVRRAQETGKELAWEASREALASCELPLDRIDAVCLTSAPDAFDGVHMKGSTCPTAPARSGGRTCAPTSAAAAACSPRSRRTTRSRAGWPTSCSRVAEEKMSSTQPHPQGAFLTIFDNILERPLGPNLLWIFALEMNRYMTVHGIDKRDIAAVAVKNKRNAADHPAALLGQADITIEDVLASRPSRGRCSASTSRRSATARSRSSSRARRPPKQITERSGLDPGRGLEPRHGVLDQPRPRVPGVRRERRPHGLRDGRRDRAAQADPRRRAVRPVRLQGAAPPRGTAAVRQGQGARGGPRRRPRPQGRPALVPERRPARRRQPDRRGRLDEDRRALLAAPRRGRRPPGPRYTRSAASRRPGAT